VGLPSSIELGPYQLHERIGEGGNGQVYRATGPTGTVAVKLLGAAADFDEAGRARFRREIAALGQLAHPNLVRMLDHGVDAELGPYLVLPLLPGATLRTLCRGQALCPEAAILLVQPVVEATAALHAAGYVHRDLKPENSIATPDGTITVIDLGLAWGEGMSRHTESGAAVGSVGYMSPEQLDARPVGAPADVWALGVMLYECVAGKRPFARTRPTEEVAATLLGTHARLTAADRRAGEDLAELVANCLVLDPARRPTAAQLAAALAAMIDWAPAERLADERAAAVADPVGYQQRIAAFRVRRLERLAHEAIDGGKPFAALAHCDRGLAYVPDHPVLVELIAAAEAATARSPASVPPSVPAPPAFTDPDLATGGPPRTDSTVGHVAHAASAVRWTRKKQLAIGGGGLLAIAIVVILLVVPNRDSRPARDPWAGDGKGLTQTEIDEAKERDQRNTETLRMMAGLFGRALDMAEKADQKGKPPAVVGRHGQPTTASGWLQLAASQEPDESLASVRQALRLSPD
jgi:serine/threonine-protein kinase